MQSRMSAWTQMGAKVKLHTTHNTYPNLNTLSRLSTWVSLKQQTSSTCASNSHVTHNRKTKPARTFPTAGRPSTTPWARGLPRGVRGPAAGSRVSPTGPSRSHAHSEKSMLQRSRSEGPWSRPFRLSRTRGA